MEDVLTGTLSDGRRKIKLHIATDEGEFEPLLALARATVDAFDGLEAKAHRAATDGMLSKYNQVWRHSTVADGKGGLKDVSDPELTADEFAERLILKQVWIDADNKLTFDYYPGDMFWGHGILVHSFDGVAFSDVHVEMVG
jgi:hypothetical protein